MTGMEQTIHQKKKIGKNLRKLMSQMLLMFFMLKKKKYIYAYVSKNNLNREKQVILLMISNGEKGQLHYLALTKLSVLLRGIMSKHYC